MRRERCLVATPATALAPRRSRPLRARFNTKSPGQGSVGASGGGGGEGRRVGVGKRRYGDRGAVEEEEGEHAAAAAAVALPPPPPISCLPEVLHGATASYLSLPEILCLSATCRDLRSVMLGLITHLALRLPCMNTRRRGARGRATTTTTTQVVQQHHHLLLQEDGGLQQQQPGLGGRSLRGLLGALKRLQSLTVRDEWALRGVAEAVIMAAAGGGGWWCCRRLVRLTCEDFKVSVESGQLVAQALGALPALEDFNALKADAEQGAMCAVFDALGRGACPRLTQLDLGRLLNREMTTLACAMQQRGRVVPACRPLAHIWGLGIERNTACMGQELGRFLGSPGCGSLQTLCLMVGGAPLVAVNAYLRERPRPALERLSLRAVRDCPAPCLAEFFELLASGAAPGLRALEVEGLEARDEDVPWLQPFLRWVAIREFSQMELFVLKSYSVTWVAASLVLANLMRTQTRLQRISINGPDCWIDEARGGAADAIEKGRLVEARSLGFYVVKAGDTSWRRILVALANGRVLCPELRELYVLVNVDVGEEAMRLLAKVLEAGGGRGLVSLYIQDFQTGPSGVEAVISALGSGACPHLQRLAMAFDNTKGRGEEGSEEEGSSSRRMEECRVSAARVLERQAPHGALLEWYSGPALAPRHHHHHHH